MTAVAVGTSYAGIMRPCAIVFIVVLITVHVRARTLLRACVRACDLLSSAVVAGDGKCTTNEFSFHFHVF